MRAEQAIYGTVRNGHGLRAASGDRVLAEQLAPRLDLPDTAPFGATWSPFTSGFAVGEHYVVARTFHDPTVSRSGMVVTHALICPASEVVAFNDLRPLLGHLMESIDDEPRSPQALDVTLGHEIPPAAPELQTAAQALTTRGEGPVIRIGNDGFEELVVSLWGHLWPSLRHRLYFRLSFGPNDVRETPVPTIVCTPASLIGRWHQRRIIGQIPAAPNNAACMIDGAPDGEEMRAFVTAIGAKLISFDDLRLAEQAYALTSNEASVAQLVNAVRLIQRLSPDPSAGVAEKAGILNRLVGGLRSAEPADILTLRNLDPKAFPGGDRIWGAMSDWLEGYTFPVSADVEMTTALGEALVDEDAMPAWREAVRTGLRTIPAVGRGELATAFWRWAKIDEAAAHALMGLLAEDKNAIAAVVNAAPDEMDETSAKPIIASAARLKLYYLHAAAVAASLKPVDAARAQSLVEPGADAAAMRIALRRAKPTEVLDAAAAVDDERLVEIAGEEAARLPALLSKRDMKIASNRSVWNAALAINADAWRGPADPRQAFDEMLDEQIDGGKPPQQLLEYLSTTPLADLSAFPRRHDLWQHLPGAVRDRLLAATVDGWFSRAADHQHNNPLEPEMANRILQDVRLDPLLTRMASGRVAEGFRLIGTLGGVEGVRFRNWIMAVVNSTRELQPAEAGLLGRAVAALRRSDIVKELLRLYSGGRADLKPALRHCLDLMGFFDKLFLDVVPVSDTEKWSSFVDLAVQLYPSGPDENALWERIGGRDGDLQHHGTGRERWRDAARDIQNGKGPRIWQLVSAMRDDFPGNSDLKLLANDTLFRG